MAAASESLSKTAVVEEIGCKWVPNSTSELVAAEPTTAGSTKAWDAGIGLVLAENEQEVKSTEATAYLVHVEAKPVATVVTVAELVVELDLYW